MPASSSSVAAPRPAAVPAPSAAAEFVTRARRVLDTRAVALVSRDRSEPLASAGGADDVQRLLAAVARPEEERSHLLTLPIGGPGESLGTLCVLGDEDWSLDSRTRRMLAVFAESAADVVTPPDPGTSVRASTLLTAARILTDLSLTAAGFEEMVGGITATIAPLVDAAKVGIALGDREGKYLQLIPGSFGAAEDVVVSSQVSTSDGQSASGRVFQTGRAWFTNDTRGDMPQMSDWHKEFGISDLLSLPLSITGAHYSLLHVANKATQFTEEDARTLETLLPFVVGVVEHVRRRLDLERREALASVVSRAATASVSGQAMTDFSDMHAEFCRIIGAQRLAITGADGWPGGMVRAGTVSPVVEEAFLAECTRRPMVVRTQASRPVGAGDRGWAALHTPVVLAGQHQATLSLLRMPCQPFSEDERRVIQRLANVISLAWATERYQHERAQMARMRERQRIADDLHDHVAQLLFSGKLTLEFVLEQLEDEDAVRPQVERARDLLVKGEVVIREVISHLVPAEPMSLVNRLADLVQTIEEEFDLPVHLEIEPAGIELVDGLPASAADSMLAGAREAVTNAAKHAGPCRVWVTTKVIDRRRLQIAVVDDGLGRTTADCAEGYGLSAVRRRLQPHEGTVRIARGVPTGTSVLISVPLHEGPA